MAKYRGGLPFLPEFEEDEQARPHPAPVVTVPPVAPVPPVVVVPPVVDPVPPVETPQ